MKFFRNKAEKLAEEATKNMPIKIAKAVSTIITTLFTIIPIILSIVGILIFIVAIDWITELFTAKANAKEVYSSLKVKDMSDIVQIKQNSDGEYYLDFIDGVDDTLEDYINKMNEQAGYHLMPKDVEFLKKIIEAELCMKYPNLGGSVPEGEDGFQGVVNFRRVTPDKGIGKMVNTGEGEKTVIEEEPIDDVVEVNEYEDIVKGWEKNKQLEIISKAIVYKERESKLHPGTGTGYFDVQYRENSEKKLVIPRGSKVTYTGNYKSRENPLTKQVTTYVEVQYEDITGYIVAQTVISIDSEETEDIVEEISSVKDIRTTSRAKGLIMGKEGKTYTIAIAAGHNNTDNTGASSGELVEEQLTIKVAEKVEELLKDYSNVKVVQTGSTSDNPGGVKLSDRRQLARDAKPDLCIQVHFNAGGGTGSEVIYKKDDGISQELAEILSKTISSSMGIKNRGDGSDIEKCSGRSLTIIENAASTGFPSVVTEGAFLDGSPDADIIKNQNGVLKYAQGIVDGLNEYFKSDHKGHSSTSKEHETVTSSIRSNISNLKYIPLDEFKRLIDENDTKALKLLTLDDEKKVITATWKVDEEGNIIVVENPPIDLTTTLQQYVVPFEYLMFFYIDSNYEDFSKDLADEILKSEVVVAVQDNITTTKKVTVNQNKTDASDSRFSSDWSNAGSTTVITEEVSTSANVTYVDTWCVKTYNDNSYSTKSLEMGDKDKVTINVGGTVSETNSTSLSEANVTGSGTANTGEIDADGNPITYSYTNYSRDSITTDTIANQYVSGENHTKGVENKFVKLYHKHGMNTKVRTSGYLFSIIEQNEKTANLLNLTKYLIYKATDMEYDKVIEYDFGEFDLEEFNGTDSSESGSSSVYASGSALLEYLKAWEGHEGLSPDKKKYKIGLVYSNRTVGYGIDLETSGFEPRFKKAGYSTNVGDYVDVDFVDNLTKEELETRRKAVISQTSKCKPPLNEQQIDALAVVSYQYGNIGNFVSMYAKYGNTEELRNNCQAYKSGGGLNANGYYFTTKIGGNPESNGRCDANWKLFHTGKYTDQSGNEIKVVSASGGTIVQNAVKVHEYVRKNGYYYLQAGIKVPNTTTKTIDCSSFVTWVLIESKVKGFTEGMYQWTSGNFNDNPKGWKTVKESEAQPGDILVYDTHVEIVAKNDPGSSKFTVYNCGGNPSIQAEGTKDLPESSQSGHYKSSIRKILRVTK